MKYSGERISYLSDRITAAIIDSGEPGIGGYVEIKSAVVRALRAQVAKEEKTEEKVRSKILSLSRKVEEGTREWELLFRQYLEEEHSKSAATRKEWL